MKLMIKAYCDICGSELKESELNIYIDRHSPIRADVMAKYYKVKEIKKNNCKTLGYCKNCYIKELESEITDETNS